MSRLISAFAMESFEELSKILNAAVTNESCKAVLPLLSSEKFAKQLFRWKLFSNLRKRSDNDDDLFFDHQHSEIEWIFNDTSTLELLLCSGYVQDHRWREVLELLCKILVADTAARSGFKLRLAVAISITFSTPVMSLAEPTKSIDALERYRSFVGWAETGKLFPIFRQLTAWQLRYVVGSWAGDDELVWAREHVKKDFCSPHVIGEATHAMMKYKETNDDGISIHEGAKYYKNKPVTMAVLLNEGAVCGGISKFGCAMSQAFGIPAMPVGQTGHCALLWWREGEWILTNDVSGLGESTVHDGIQYSWGRTAEYVVLMEYAQQNFTAFILSEKLRIAAKFLEKTVALGILDTAAAYSKFNFLVWRDLAQICGDLMRNGSCRDWILNSMIRLDYCEKFAKNRTVILSKHKTVKVSDCAERGQNLVDGTGSEWWTDKEAAWFEIDLGESCHITGIEIQWWGTSISKNYTVYAARKDGRFTEVSSSADEKESPKGYNSWSKLGGWKMQTSAVKVFLKDGSLDPWGLGKWFGIRQILILGEKEALFDVLSINKAVRVSECQERAQNITDGSASEWWAECKDAWLEISLGQICYVEQISLQWWGISAAKEIAILISTDEQHFHKKQVINLETVSEPNSWESIKLGLAASDIRIELRNGQWNNAKYFGLRNVVVYGTKISIKDLLITNAKKQLSRFPVVERDVCKALFESDLQILSHMAKCRASDCQERAQNITDGSQSEWWSENQNAWVEIELKSYCKIEGVKIQWWGTSVSKDLSINVVNEMGEFCQVKTTADEVESPTDYNGWSIYTGWSMKTKLINFELKKGSLDPWGMGKYFGIRQIIVIGLYCS